MNVTLSQKKVFIKKFPKQLTAARKVTITNKYIMLSRTDNTHFDQFWLFAETVG